MKKWILQHGTDAIDEIQSIVAPYNKMYADKFGFTYVLDTKNTYPPFGMKGPKEATGILNPYWEKLRVIDECFEKAENGDFVEWADMDAIHMNHDLDVSTLLPEGFDMSLRMSPELPINAGVMFFRVNEITRLLLKRCLRYGVVSDEDWAGRGACGWEERRIAVEMMMLQADPSDPEAFGLRVHPMSEKTHYYHPTQEETILHVGSRPLSDKLIVLRMAIALLNMKGIKVHNG